MAKLIVMILFCSVSLLMAGTYTVKSSAQLYKALQNGEKDLTINLEAGEYDLTPVAVTDSTLGNAENPDSMITVTTGLHLVSKNIQLIGKDRRKTIIRTYAGYGIFIEHCPEVLIKNLTITDGTRDQNPNATSAAIIVKHSHTEITGCIIENNQGDFSKTIAGIIGICGREGSDLDIHNNIIRDNSWDGIALYRKAKARIENNLIYNGRGAGIGITWDSDANVSKNVIHHYWKGIGTFGTSHANVSHNLVRDVRGWGIIASGNSQMQCVYNEVRRAGNVGIALWNDTASIFIASNVICQSGTEKQWLAPLVGIWINAHDSLITIDNNLFWGNKEADIAYGYVEPGRDGSAFTFAQKAEKFNNYIFQPTKTLNQANYYTTKYQEPLYMSFIQTIRNPDTGIYAGFFKTDPWTWDPDKEPFQD